MGWFLYEESVSTFTMAGGEKMKFEKGGVVELLVESEAK